MRCVPFEVVEDRRVRICDCTHALLFLLFAELDCALQVAILLRRLTCVGLPPAILVTALGTSIIVDARAVVVVAGSTAPPPLPERLRVQDKVCNVLGDLSDVHTLVNAIVVNVLELPEGLDLVEVILAVLEDVLGAIEEEVLQDGECLRTKHVSSGTALSTPRKSVTLKTCLQFLPLSLSRLSRTSMISMKSMLRRNGGKGPERRMRLRTYLLYDMLAISFISLVVGGSGSLLVCERTFFCVGEYPLVTFLHARTVDLPN